MRLVLIRDEDYLAENVSFQTCFVIIQRRLNTRTINYLIFFSSNICFISTLFIVRLLLQFKWTRSVSIVCVTKQKSGKCSIFSSPFCFIKNIIYFCTNLNWKKCIYKVCKCIFLSLNVLLN